MFDEDSLVSTQPGAGGNNHLGGLAIAQGEAMKQKQIRYSCFASLCDDKRQRLRALADRQLAHSYGSKLMKIKRSFLP
jgi:hypothetical protein